MLLYILYQWSVDTYSSWLQVRVHFHSSFSGNHPGHNLCALLCQESKSCWTILRQTNLQLHVQRQYYLIAFQHTMLAYLCNVNGVSARTLISMLWNVFELHVFMTYGWPLRNAIQYSLIWNLVPSKRKSFRAARTNFVFIALMLLTLFLVIIIIGFAIARYSNHKLLHHNQNSSTHTCMHNGTHPLPLHRNIMYYFEFSINADLYHCAS